VYWAPAIGADGTIYVGSGARLYAINPDGTQKWLFVTEDDAASSPAIGADGTVYIGCDDHKLYAVNPDGSKKWAFDAGDGVSSSPAIGADGTVYVGSDSGRFWAINPDGTSRWSFLAGGRVTSPAIGANGTVYFGSTDDKLYALGEQGPDAGAPQGGATGSGGAFTSSGTGGAGGGTGAGAASGPGVCLGSGELCVPGGEFTTAPTELWGFSDYVAYGPWCFRVKYDITSWGCGNFHPRQFPLVLQVNGVLVLCGAMPLPPKTPDGWYYFDFFEGATSDSYFYWH
jgi:outer membrane protein assembly factor BamB